MVVVAVVAAVAEVTVAMVAAVVAVAATVVLLLAPKFNRTLLLSRIKVMEEVEEEATEVTVMAVMISPHIL